MDKYMSLILGIIAIFLVAFFLLFFANDLGLSEMTLTNDVYMKAIVWIVVLFVSVFALVRGN